MVLENDGPLSLQAVDQDRLGASPPVHAIADRDIVTVSGFAA
jgi:hypothetical protein